MPPAVAAATAAGGATPAGTRGTHTDTAPKAGEKSITVKFIDRDGNVIPIEAPLGVSMLELAHDHGIDLEGACEGSLACSTCHVYVDQENYDKLEEPSDDENDMLDLAFGLEENSRLGCQVVTRAELDGMEVRLPTATRNMAVDGYVPKPH